MNDQTPRLPGFRGAGQTLKAEELLDTAFTIVDSQTTIRRDGTTAHKWTVQHGDGTLGLYWAPGMQPPHQVTQWFRANPGRPLHVTLARYIDDGNGYPRWELRQIDEAEVEPLFPDAHAPGEADTDPDDIPF